MSSESHPGWSAKDHERGERFLKRIKTPPAPAPSPRAGVEIAEAFRLECWLPFLQFYKESIPLSLTEGGGTPSRLVWSEHDFVLQLASRAANHWGPAWVHMEVQLGRGRRLELVITDPIRLMSGHEFRRPPYDFAAEFKTIGDDRKSSWSWEAVAADAERLLKLQEEGVVAAGGLCVIDKVGEEGRKGGVKVVRDLIAGTSLHLYVYLDPGTEPS